LRAPMSTLFPYTTLFRSLDHVEVAADEEPLGEEGNGQRQDRQPARHERLVEIRALRTARGLLLLDLHGLSRLTRGHGDGPGRARSEEHTSELQSRFDLVC